MEHQLVCGSDLCETLCPFSQFFCFDCARMLPIELQEEVQRAYGNRLDNFTETNAQILIETYQKCLPYLKE